MSAVDWDKVYEGHMNQLQFTSWNGLNIGRLTLAIWILASHLALIVFLLAKSSLRRQPKNLLIINVSLTNLVLGVFLVPTKLHFILAPAAEGSCQLSMAWTLLNDYYQVSACTRRGLDPAQRLLPGECMLEAWHGPCSTTTTR